MVHTSVEAPEASESLILWNVVESHLDEAEFAVEQFEQALDAPDRVLRELGRYPEERLHAHIDGLVVGGDEVREKLLIPALEAADPEQAARVAAVSLALVSADRYEVLLPALSHEKPGVRRAAVRGAALAGRSGLDRWTLEQLEQTSVSPVRASLLQIAAARHLPPPPLMESLQSEDVELVAAAACAAQFGTREMYLPILEHLLGHDAVSVQDSALVAALAWGSQRAWATCQTLALERTKNHSFARAIYASLGNRSHHEELIGLLHDEQARPSTLFALGFSGNTGMLPVLLEHLKSSAEIEAKLAAQAVATITGLDILSEPFFLRPRQPREELELPPAEDDAEAMASLPPLEDDDLDADITPQTEDSLPTPNVEAIESFCRQEGARMGQAQRLLGGVPYSYEVVLDFLGTAPMRRRHIVALTLGIRTSGSVWLDTRAFSTAQLVEIAKMRGRRNVRFIDKYF